MSDTVRVFVALELPAVVKEALAATTVRLGDAVPEGKIRWTPVDSFHLTLKFLGDVDGSQVSDIVGSVRSIASEYGPFALQTGKTGAFPASGKARVIWAGIGGDLDVVRRLQADVETAATDMGFERDKRPFNPHVTLGRARKAGVALPSGVASTKPILFRVDRVTVMKSDLHPTGAEHTPLGYGPLGV